MCAVDNTEDFGRTIASHLNENLSRFAVKLNEALAL